MLFKISAVKINTPNNYITTKLSIQFYTESKELPNGNLFQNLLVLSLTGKSNLQRFLTKLRSYFNPGLFEVQSKSSVNDFRS